MAETNVKEINIVVVTSHGHHYQARGVGDKVTIRSVTEGGIMTMIEDVPLAMFASSESSVDVGGDTAIGFRTDVRDGSGFIVRGSDEGRRTVAIRIPPSFVASLKVLTEAPRAT